MPVPVENDVSVGRLPAAVEATAYFVVAEALTNVAKHARAGRAEVTARVEDGTLGSRCATTASEAPGPTGSGLVGLADRLAALDGRLRVESPPDGGTLVADDVPVLPSYDPIAGGVDCCSIEAGAIPVIPGPRYRVGRRAASTLGPPSAVP